MSAAWLKDACRLLQSERAIVRVTVATTRGSAPREPGATLLVSATQQCGTIGGGNLEWQAVEQARRMLDSTTAPAVCLEHLRLGPDLAQCCGGDVNLWLERIANDERMALEQLRAAAPSRGALLTVFQQGKVQRSLVENPSSQHSACALTQSDSSLQLLEGGVSARHPLYVFGAGHVGQAVVRLLQQVPLFELTWIDNRTDIASLAAETGASLRLVPEPVDQVAAAPRGAYWLVLTHDHELDFQLCASILARGDAGWLGLIGSASKAARFRSRLRRAGHADAAIAQLTCPVGLTAIQSKLPAAIAVGVVAQLLERVTQLERVTRPERVAQPERVLQPERATLVVAAQAAALPCDPACGRCAERRLA